MNKIKGSTALINRLIEHDVCSIYGIMGREAEFFSHNDFKALKFQSFHHEQNAIIAAEAASRLDGLVRVCAVTMGPGITNAMTGIASAFCEKSPVVILGFQVERHLRGPETHQYVNTTSLVSSITKKVFEPETMEELLQSIDESFALARKSPWGPCLISVPVDLLSIETKTRERLPLIKKKNEENTSIDELISRVNLASSPMVFFGSGATRMKSDHLFKEIVEKNSLPFATSITAKGIIDERHPLSMGVFSKYSKHFYGTDLRLLTSAQFDLALLIGFDNTEGLEINDFIDTDKTKVIFLNDDPEILLKALSKKSSNKTFGLTVDLVPFKNRQLRQTLFKGPDVLFKMGQVLSEQMSDRAVLVSDVGIHKHIVSLSLMSKGPRSYIGSNSLATMGFGLPASIGIALNEAVEKTYLVCGDGGFFSALGELETIARLKLNIIIIVVNNRSFELIDLYSKKSDSNNQLEFTKFKGADYELLAGSFGLKYKMVKDDQQLNSALDEFKNLSGPVLLNFYID